MYEGEYEFDKKNGFGEKTMLIYDKKDNKFFGKKKYKGHFINDKMNGLGRLEFYND